MFPKIARKKTRREKKDSINSSKDLFFAGFQLCFSLARRTLLSPARLNPRDNSLLPDRIATINSVVIKNLGLHSPLTPPYYIAQQTIMGVMRSYE